MMPRQAQDELATLFWKQKAKLWFLETYQVGGWNPEIAPLAPTPTWTNQTSFYQRANFNYSQSHPSFCIYSKFTSLVDCDFGAFNLHNHSATVRLLYQIFTLPNLVVQTNRLFPTRITLLNHTRDYRRINFPSFISPPSNRSL